MRISAFVSAIVVALAAIISLASAADLTTTSSASAADRFTMMDGVTAVPMSSGEMDAVKGLHVHFKVFTGSGKTIPNTGFLVVGDPAAKISGTQAENTQAFVLLGPVDSNAPAVKFGLYTAQCTGSGAVGAFDGPLPHAC